jgi:D-arabinose 1-dehydrogenase-like Zn-dependent alcohol dehydrogenase
MRGVVLARDGVKVTDDLPEPELTSDGLLLRVLGVGVCGGDVALVSGRRPAPSYPWLIGHEAACEVLTVGADVTGWAVGDRAVLEPNVVDLTCPACRRGVTSACWHRDSAGVITQPGFLAEQVAFPAEFAHHCPHDARLEDLSFAPSR